MTYDRRLLAGETREEALESIRNVIAGLAKQDPELRATVEYYRDQGVCYTGAKIEADGYFPAWLLPEDSMLVERALYSLMSIGAQPKLGTWSFCTNGSESSGKRNIPTIGFGPGSANQTHRDDEYIEVAQLLKASEGYAAIAKGMLE